MFNTSNISQKKYLKYEKILFQKLYPGRYIIRKEEETNKTLFPFKKEKKQKTNFACPLFLP